ncbi:hypothetical protein B4065_0456 [Caldibacillus thermoamylovorans]|uniref:Lipoprotein n=1 Tax=Caldibacillus thermoamylovorans TaxID=35841 RepID=A0ABD4A598_9BACI|nr:hypothetical protein B4065_0456 [Caldibacillus thermoamylovorans]KIO70417.1 hypothetical protein B4166_0581 [Caldibacillus thermoamylovorans]KIO72350.1 hypothetical protein B4167_0678 [Caldibacillus thermoamylovorans]
MKLPFLFSLLFVLPVVKLFGCSFFLNHIKMEKKNRKVDGIGKMFTR